MLWGGRRKEGQKLAKWQWLASWYLRSIAIYMFNVPFNPCDNSIPCFSKTNYGGKEILNTQISQVNLILGFTFISPKMRLFEFLLCEQFV